MGRRGAKKILGGNYANSKNAKGKGKKELK